MQPGEWREKLNRTDEGSPGEDNKWLSLKFIYKA